MTTRSHTQVSTACSTVLTGGAAAPRAACRPTDDRLEETGRRIGCKGGGFNASQEEEGREEDDAEEGREEDDAEEDHQEEEEVATLVALDLLRRRFSILL